ncbi:MAG: hypothetical protein NT074_06980 [Methanomicrobiales archaeon]|nr:hypothetical protein [Methanomicrobiales archaeon]
MLMMLIVQSFVTLGSINGTLVSAVDMTGTSRPGDGMIIALTPGS